MARLNALNCALNSVQVHEKHEFRAIREWKSAENAGKTGKTVSVSVLARQLAVKRKPLNMKGLCGKMHRIMH